VSSLVVATAVIILLALPFFVNASFIHANGERHRDVDEDCDRATRRGGTAGSLADFLSQGSFTPALQPSRALRQRLSQQRIRSDAVMRAGANRQRQSVALILFRDIFRVSRSMTLTCNSIDDGTMIKRCPSTRAERSVYAYFNEDRSTCARRQVEFAVIPLPTPM